METNFVIQSDRIRQLILLKLRLNENSSVGNRGGVIIDPGDFRLLIGYYPSTSLLQPVRQVININGS